MTDLQQAVKDSVDKLMESIDTQADKLFTQIEGLEIEIEELRERKPLWGNCRNGCDEAYLDREGYCSPACHMGGRKGMLYTIGQRRDQLNGKAHGL